ncbi:C-type lectin domain-containing protein [Caenorhabditis elegans]|uniref:C-type lectin domain-containing protein n=1 Tax=Caenorhabditis elegans TaxID=6239 RepID=Q9TXW7_CAEEL|nr:C-type lectin domain-containing protein [Caenorhabditis elegans]CCD67816.1 C-type lectin domain-containing protein [Caenorhabditis elegans]|eukprot:NP_503855.2 C-type LECtin [Caenorhabditis elegans]
MISKFLRLSLILAQVHISVSDICRYPHEKFIGSRCYAFVPKRHNFETAEIYCHGQGYSLATVDSAITSNFLASSAATEFGSNSGQFWIGLSRKTEFQLFYWDDGTNVAFTHFDAGFPNELNYVAENVKNGRWQTRDDQDELAFVCSYDPSLTTTTAPSTSLPTSTISTTKPTTTTSVRTTTQWNAVTSTTLQQSTKRTGCPDGFTYFAPTQKCYIVVVYGYDSDYPPVPIDAPFLTKENQRCQKYGTTIATIHSSSVNDFFTDLIKKSFNDSRFATIGLRNTDLKATGGKWQWFDGSSADFLKFGDSFPKTGDYIAQTSAQGFWVTYTHTAANEGVVCSVDF